MKAMLNTLLLLDLVLLCGCAELNMRPYGYVSRNYVEVNNSNICDSCESGYYYNGYNENGWRYCIVQVNRRR